MGAAQDYYCGKPYSVMSRIRAVDEKKQRLYSKIYTMGGRTEEIRKSGVWWGEFEQMEGRQGQ